MNSTSEDDVLLSPLAAAHHLGITPELLFQYTKPSFAKVSRLRTLKTVERSGRTQFAVSELDEFDVLLAGPWPSSDSRRAAIPKAILDHLRAESLNQCARCGSGIGVDTAHIRSYAESRSHHHANLIRLCSACHREHDAHDSLSNDELASLKNFLIERTRANLTVRMEPAYHIVSMPRPTSNFIGRKSELLSLADALQSGRSVVITGVGGIGKTELLVQALHGLETGRPVFWIDVEKYRNASDILAALQTALKKEGIACPMDALPARLDALQACLVFDGIERAALDDIDEFEDTIVALYSATMTAQFVATSQIVLHKLSADIRVKVDKLDELTSQQLLENLSSYDGSRGKGDLGPLLEFCEGHILTIRLTSALMNHYGGPSAALRAIKTKGVTVVNFPARKRQSRATSLELCLGTAYAALSLEGRELLWALAESPAGLITHYLEGDWLGLPDPIEALAELRRWHLADFVHISGNLSRTHVLGPIRAFAIECARREDGARYEAMLGRMVQAHGMMVAVLECKYDDPNDTPYVLQRYADELPNLLHTLDLARDNKTNTQMLMTSVSIIRSLMRYFFVRRLSDQGARVMHDAAELALSAQHLKSASGLILQLVALAQRVNSASLVKAGLKLADRLELLTQDDETLADIAMSRGIAAQEADDYAAAESYARKAYEGYRTCLRTSVDRQFADLIGNSIEPFDREELHNNVSGALGLLGFSLISLGRYEEATKAYRHSLQHQRGASAAVNRGQTLHQIGNCESCQGLFREAATYYLEAAKTFYFMSMEEYLSNALSELGYALLDTEAANFLKDVNNDLIEQGLLDLERDIRRAFDPARPFDHSRSVSVIRKLFGCIMLVSLIGKGRLLGEFFISINELFVILANQLSNGERDQEEAFPLLMIDTALQLGILVAEAEYMLEKYGDISRETIGKMLRMICNAHDWARNTMRIIDWFAALLTRRWGYQDACPIRLREFIKNYDNDVVDYLNLARNGGI